MYVSSILAVLRMVEVECGMVASDGHLAAAAEIDISSLPAVLATASGRLVTIGTIVYHDNVTGRVVQQTITTKNI